MNKELNQEQLEKANGGYSPPEYDDCPQYQNPNNTNDDNDNSKRDLDRAAHNISIDK